MSSNKVLPIFAGVIMLLVVFIGMKSFTKKPPELALQAVPVAPRPDADSPADTVRTLTSHVAEVKSQYSHIEQQNAQLLDQKTELANSLKDTLTNELNKLSQTTNPQVNALSAQVDALKAQLAEVVQKPAAALAGDTNLSPALNPTPPTLEVVWVEPLRALPSVNLGNTGLPPSFLNPNGSVSNSSGANASGLNPASASGSSLENSTIGGSPALAAMQPAYTVPRNATLIGSTAMTALIGKIPYKDTIADPFPFKVIVGRDNLAANGIDIPGLDGMVFSGHSSGDWTLACVRGNVDSATFVFGDGTIRTVSGNTQNSNNGSNPSGNTNNMLGNGSYGSSGGPSNMAIGWISDKRGIPCVSGTRISNAADYLAGRILARAAESTAKAFAQTNVTQSVTPIGGVINAITGKAAEYAGFNALAGGATEISDYLRERAAQSFDVVYVDTGVELAIHIDRELAIDYDPSGRKTTYEAQNNTRQSAFD